MDINEYRSTRATKLAEEPPKLVKHITATVKTGYLEKNGGMKSFPYRGYTICQSNITGKWWVMNNMDKLVSWADHYEDGRNTIDYIIDRMSK